jgi:5-methylcytosine-specific restriction endonuclease McrA
MLQTRDNGLCQFNDCTARGTTIDHIVPRSRGGTTTWENCVMSCQEHNFKKADRTLESLGWTLKKKPEPVYGPMVLLARIGRNAELPEWSQWLTAAG